MKERLQRIIDMLEMVEVRRTQNHKLIAGVVDALRAIQSEIAEDEKETQKNEPDHFSN